MSNTWLCVCCLHAMLHSTFASGVDVYENLKTFHRRISEICTDKRSLGRCPILTKWLNHNEANWIDQQHQRTNKVSQTKPQIVVPDISWSLVENHHVSKSALKIGTLFESYRFRSCDWCGQKPKQGGRLPLSRLPCPRWSTINECCRSAQHNLKEFMILAQECHFCRYNSESHSPDWARGVC